MGDDNGHDPFDLGQLLFGYLVYREIRDGRLDGDAILRAGCLLVLLVGAVLGGGLLLIGAFAAPQYGGGYAPYETPFTYPTEQPAIVPPVSIRPAPTVRPTPTPTPSPTPKPTPRPSPLPGIGTRVPAGDGWAVTVTKVQRWRPSWYREPGWRLITVYLKVRMPAVEYACAWGDAFWVEARSGRTYQGWLDQQVREPQLFACADYHRATTDTGWVTFEVRDADAKGLVLYACLPAYSWCETPAGIRLK
jgi:hypothetical protein